MHLFSAHQCFKPQQSLYDVLPLSVQLRTAMVKGETGTMALDVRAAVDKGVSVFATFMLNYFNYFFWLNCTSPVKNMSI